MFTRCLQRARVARPWLRSAMCGVAAAVVSWCGAVRSAGAQAAPTPAPTAAVARARASRSIVTIVAYRDGTTDVTSGAGIRVADGRVLTALRHLRGAVRADVFNAEGELLGTVTTLDQADVKLDLAVLPRLAQTGDRLVLARRSAVLAQKVSVIGPRPGQANAIVERTVTHVEPDDAGRPLLRLGAPVVGSAAGSAVVNARGELVAVAIGTLPGRDDGDVAIDLVAIREVLARPSVRLGLPARDGSIAAARAPTDATVRAPVSAATGARSPAEPPPVRARTSVFPERYGAPVSTDTAGPWVVELHGCARLESRQKVFCYLRVTNRERGGTFAVKGADLADSTRKKLRSAENLLQGETVQRVAGWRTKAEVPLRELESVRIALEFAPPERDGDAVRLMLDVAGEKTLWLGPFVLQRAP
jgi:hypothetical protein